MVQPTSRVLKQEVVFDNSTASHSRSLLPPAISG
jgi:hypothetical protein